jgi:hypothetical protein
VIVEATAVTRDGRISPGDMGIWSDEHIEPLARIARFVESQGSVAGIQLAHAGRKGSREVPWRGGNRLKSSSEAGWQVVAPSPLPFKEGDPAPHELSVRELDDIVSAFEAAANRALTAGFKASKSILLMVTYCTSSFRPSAISAVTTMAARSRIGRGWFCGSRTACAASSRTHCHYSFVFRRATGSRAAGPLTIQWSWHDGSRAAGWI